MNPVAKSKIRYATFADWTRPGKASEIIQPFRIERGRKYVVLCRVSSHEQGKRANLENQKVMLRKLVEEGGGIVIAVIEHEWSGKGSRWLEMLDEAATVALKNDATILAATTDRLIRSSWFYSNRKERIEIRAQKLDLRDLRTATWGVPLMTFLDPDAPAEECRSLTIRWGQEVKGNKGGRPLKKGQGYRKRRKAKYLPRIQEMCESGCSRAQIVKTIVTEAGVERMTVYRWIKEVNENGLVV